MINIFKSRYFILGVAFLSITFFPIITFSQDRKYISFTKSLFDKIYEINKKWNDKVKYRKDVDQYGMSNFWAYPEPGYGDCEDYCIAKQKDLADIGIDSFFAWCITEKGEGHIVLFVFTTRGALVLDNLTDMVLLASQKKATNG